MNEDIIRMAREVGIEWDLIDDDEGQIWYIHPGTLERFADIVRAAEQDRCCRIIFGMAGSDNVAQRTVDAIRSKV